MTRIKDMQVVLASSSPRRIELLRQIGIEPLVMPSSYAEVHNGLDALSMVEQNTRGKLLDVVQKYNLTNALVIAADTVVVLDNQVFGKPNSDQVAIEMLNKLSGKTHKVVTGVAIYYMDEIMYDYKATDVYMKSMNQSDILSYVATGEPHDKAGGYGIQARAAVFVDRIDGCYSNVVGLPLPLLYSMLNRLLISIF